MLNFITSASARAGSNTVEKMVGGGLLGKLVINAIIGEKGIRDVIIEDIVERSFFKEKTAERTAAAIISEEETAAKAEFLNKVADEVANLDSDDYVSFLESIVEKRKGKLNS